MIASDGKNKSVVIVSQWFPPEHAPIGYMLKELAGFMAQNGWDVEVVTGFPNHPTGRVHSNYSKRRLLRERVDNFDVVRLWLFTSERRSFFTRSLNFLSFTFSVLMYLLARQRPELVFAVLQPLPMGAVPPVAPAGERTVGTACRVGLRATGHLGRVHDTSARQAAFAACTPWNDARRWSPAIQLDNPNVVVAGLPEFGC